MSKTHHKSPAAKLEPHHGTVASYIVGFALSLVFTLIPYYLVVHKSLNAKTLLVTILAFGVLQMIVQVVFFLHLGREKKPHFNLFFLMSTVGIILLVTSGSLWIMSHLYHGMSSMNMTDKIVTDEAIYQVDGKQAGTCSGQTGKNHELMLMDGMATPSHIDAHLCDTLTIMNHDETTRNLVFGAPGQAETYAGQSGPAVHLGHNKVIVLTELGTYKFRDQKLSKMSGDFTVIKQ